MGDLCIRLVQDVSEPPKWRPARETLDVRTIEEIRSIREFAGSLHARHPEANSVIDAVQDGELKRYFVKQTVPQIARTLQSIKEPPVFLGLHALAEDTRRRRSETLVNLNEIEDIEPIERLTRRWRRQHPTANSAILGVSRCYLVENTAEQIVDHIQAALANPSNGLVMTIPRSEVRRGRSLAAE